MVIKDEASTPVRGGLSVIVPAYNEAHVVAETIRSLQNQTIPPEEIIVVDDCSSDGTGEVASSLGVTVVRPPTNTGSKAGAQTFALPLITTEFAAAVDADTTLAPDALEHLLVTMEDKEVVASCGFVLPRYVRSIWERGRYVEYLFAFTFFKQIQDYYGRPLISSGCLSAYRTEALWRLGGWSDRTMAEDMDLTWGFYRDGRKVRFVPEAVCYPIEPHNFDFTRKQLRRWIARVRSERPAALARHPSRRLPALDGGGSVLGCGDGPALLPLAVAATRRVLEPVVLERLHHRRARGTHSDARRGHFAQGGGQGDLELPGLFRAADRQRGDDAQGALVGVGGA